MSVPFRVFGLQRSCTNLAGYLCLTNFDLRECEKGLEWRHWYIEQYSREIDGQ